MWRVAMSLVWGSGRRLCSACPRQRHSKLCGTLSAGGCGAIGNHTWLDRRGDDSVLVVCLEVGAKGRAEEFGGKALRAWCGEGKRMLWPWGVLG